MPLASSLQQDFSAGIYRSRVSLPNAAYDLVNLLIGDDGRPYRRGGSVNWSTSDAPAALRRIATAFLPGPAANVVVAWDSTRLSYFDGSNAPQDIDAGINFLGRPVVVAGVMIFDNPGQLILYGGATGGTGGSVDGTVTFTNGSATVTRTGGVLSWTTRLAPGMIAIPGAFATTGFGIVRSIDTNTSLTLVDPWTGPTTSTSSYQILRWAAAAEPPPVGTTFLGAAGSPARLLAGVGNRVYLTQPNAVAFDANTYHQLPSGMQITGIQGLGNTAFVFGTEGVWAISNLELAVEDDFGNIQQSVSQVSGDMILWGEHGLAAYQGGVIVPATDNVYRLDASGGAEPIGAAFHGNGIGPLIKSYVNAGYQPGPATVHQSHYFLSVLDGSNVVQDVLVCRLDRPYLLSTRPRIWGYPWTRWSGSAAGPGFATIPPTTTAGPKLLGLAGKRVTELTNAFNPAASNSQDADGTTSNAVIITQDYATADGVQKGTVRRARANYVLQGGGTHAAPTLALTVSSDEDADSYSAPTDSGLQGGGTAGAVSDGTTYSFWNMAKRRNRIRVKLTVSGASASFVLRSLELLIRPTGKR